MCGELGTDVDLLGSMLDGGEVVVDRVSGRTVTLCAKTIAAWTGLSIQSVSDYRNGVRNIPIIFWRRILDRCLDTRILEMLVPDDHYFEIFNLGPRDVLSANDLFREVVTAEIKHHQKTRYVYEILADGRVDELDARTIDAYHRFYCEHRHRDAVLHREVKRRFYEATGARAAKEPRR
jgi:hypothetical protein